MYYSIFVILLCIASTVIVIDGFSVKKSRKASTYVCFLIFYSLTQNEGTTTPLSIVCLLILMLIYYENRDKS